MKHKEKRLYYVTLNDGGSAHVDADNAGRAMLLILKTHPGRTILRCWSGGNPHPKHPAQNGIIFYEVPPHDPYTPPRRAKGIQLGLFNDLDILTVSTGAIEKSSGPL